MLNKFAPGCNYLQHGLRLRGRGAATIRGCAVFFHRTRLSKTAPSAGSKVVSAEASIPGEASPDFATIVNSVSLHSCNKSMRCVVGRLTGEIWFQPAAD